MSIRQVKVHGRKVWQARVAYQGLRSSRVCPSRDAAKLAQAELLQALQQKATTQAEQADLAPATLRKGLAFYAASLEARGKGPDTVGRARQVEAAIAATVPMLLDEPLGTFDLVEALYAFKAARGAKGIQATTTNRDLRVLRALLRQTHPDFRFPGAAFEEEDNTRVRLLAPEKQTEVFGRMPEPHRSIARLASLAVMRLSEVRLLRREQVHLEHGYLELNRPGQKKTKPRVVRLSAAARAILAHALETAETWVFPNPDGVPYSRVHVSRVWRAAAQASGLTDFHFHDLRHHGPMIALNAGASAQTVKDMGGWSSEKMMRRYATITDQTLGDAMEAVAAYGQGTPPKLVAMATARGNRRGSR